MQLVNAQRLCNLVEQQWNCMQAHQRQLPPAAAHKGRLSLEWLRTVPLDTARDYLMSIRGATWSGQHVLLVLLTMLQQGSAGTLTQQSVPYCSLQSSSA